MLNGTGGYKHGAAAVKTTGTQQKLRVHDVHTHPAEFTTRPRNNRFAQTYPASKISSWRGEPPSWPLRHMFFLPLPYVDDVTIRVSCSFMNGATGFKSQQGCKFKWNRLTIFQNVETMVCKNSVKVTNRWSECNNNGMWARTKSLSDMF